MGGHTDMKKEHKTDNSIFGQGVGKMTTDRELKSNEFNEGYKVAIINPQEFDLSDLPIKQHCERINPLSIRGNENFKTKSSIKLKLVLKWNKIKQSIKVIIGSVRSEKINKIDKSSGYYLKKYKVLSDMLKDHSNWTNDCSENENILAKEAIIKFYFEYKKLKPDKRYCAKMEMGHYSYLIYLLPIRQALIEGLYQRACNEIYSLIHYDYFLQKRIMANLLALIEEYIEIGK